MISVLYIPINLLRIMIEMSYNPHDLIFIYPFFNMGGMKDYLCGGRLIMAGMKDYLYGGPIIVLILESVMRPIYLVNEHIL